MAVAMCTRFLLQRSSHGVILSSRAGPAFSSPFLCRAHRLGPSDDEMYQRTSVGSYKDITEESVSLFHMIEPRIEIIVLGTGARIERIDPSVLALLKRKGIAVEVQDTPNACATFNILCSEGRIAAAGLIPPAVSTALEMRRE
ncbi:NADH dehydrogenase [ubiquinone] 1 alpha subcomplex assembly factor 3 [Liparis tanakae]|uniref:NADH dehydrogenase [ubiquinone] 1 alpha subcomplex assembly factor 3 n=1 Tax=Liparis tanakae TaxID=230148 RepID=A0A4Z2J6M9_9TELE|nr:NADH dehydrogenase [ubiquinone] 1 alpha subcomplex assembly factor 3 [Liparis tanakae]